MNKLRRYLSIILLLAIMTLLLAGCAEEPLQITGGDVTQCCYCLEKGKEMLANYPLITNKKISSVSLNSAHFTVKCGITVTMREFDDSDYEEYGGKYIYWLLVSLQYDDTTALIDTWIDSVSLNIDGMDYTYEIGNLHLYSLEYILKKEDAQADDGAVLVGGNISLLYSYMPGSKTDDGQTRDYASFILAAQEDILIDSYSLAGNYLSIEDLRVNWLDGKASEISTAITKGHEMKLNNAFLYGPDSSSENIIRCSQIVTYHDSSNTKHVFVVTSGIYIYPDYMTQGAVHEYIDHHGNA